MWEQPGNESTDSHEVSLADMARALEHAESANYHRGAEDEHVRAAVDAMEHGDMGAVDEHLDRAAIHHELRAEHLDAMRQSLGNEPGDDEDSGGSGGGSSTEEAHAQDLDPDD